MLVAAGLSVGTPPVSSPVIDVIPLLTKLSRFLLVGALFGAVALPAQAATPAASTTPCWKLLLGEWYGGAITTIYPLHCYTQAIDHLPADIAVYSSAKQDIQAAELAAAQHKAAPAEKTKPPVQITTNDANPPKKKGGLIGILDDLTPGNPQAFPLPLLVLGALAIVLVLAGGIGMIWQRRHPSEPGEPT